MSINELKNPNDILVAIDGSLSSQMSARAAVQFAKKQCLNIHGLYVVGSRTILEGDHNYKTELSLGTKILTSDELLKQFKSQGDEALDWLEELCIMWGVPVTTDILFGGIPEMILEEARKIGFLALGRRGHIHHTNVYALGENFQNIITHLHVPTLIGGDLMTDFKRIFMIISDHDTASQLTYWGIKFQSAFSSDILVSSFYNEETHSDQMSSALEELTKEGKVSYDQVEGKIQSGSDIVVAARDHQADLILMAGYRRIALGLWVDKHPLEDVLLNCETMVLAV